MTPAALEQFIVEKCNVDDVLDEVESLVQANNSPVKESMRRRRKANTINSVFPSAD